MGAGIPTSTPGVSVGWPPVMPRTLGVAMPFQGSRRGVGARIGAWVAELWAGPVQVDDLADPAATDAVVLLVPAYARTDELAGTAARLRGRRVAVVGYGGVGRGADRVHEVLGALRDADVEVEPFALALNSALVRDGEFSAFDVVAVGLLLDSLRERDGSDGCRDGRA
jgi:hypothetical protein